MMYLLGNLPSIWSQMLIKFVVFAQGDRTVQIEYRAGSKDGYGKGQRKPMRFGDFVDLLDAGDDKLYLTTQEVRCPEPSICRVFKHLTSS
jgi:hypothetical protein